MNTGRVRSKVLWTILTIVIMSFLIAGAWLSLSNVDKYYNPTDADRSQISAGGGVTRLYSTRPYVVAETMDKAVDYAASLGIAKEDFDYIESTIIKIDANGAWVGMSATDLLNKMAHLLLPNSVKTIDATKNDATTGIKSVHWLSITADTGSQLSSITTPSAYNSSAFYGAAWLERLDLSKATSLKTIPQYAFYTCERLYDVALPDSITSIGKWSISGSRSLMHISIPAGITSVSTSTLDSTAFYGCKKLVEVELPAGASDTFVSQVKAMSAVSEQYLNVYRKGEGRSWMVRTNDGFIFCKNVSRTSTLASGTNITSVAYAINKWYLVGYVGPESGGDTVNASNDYMVSLPEQVDLAKESINRAGQYDYLDCTGAQIKNDFSSYTSTTDLGSNVVVNSAVANNDAEGKRIIAGTQSNGAKLTYDIGAYAFFYQWVWHTTIPDNTVGTIGNYAFQTAPIWTFNLGNVNTIGTKALYFLGRTTGLIFYFPSNNPSCASDALNYTGVSSVSRLIIYRNRADYANRSTASGLHGAVNSVLETGSGKFYSYLIDVIPNVSALDTNANKYVNTAYPEVKMQRLYTNGLASYSGGEIYNSGFTYVRDESDVWRNETTMTLPALSEYTGYTTTLWYTDLDFETEYSVDSLGNSNEGSAIASLRNAYNKGLDSINIYSKRVNMDIALTNKERVYTDNTVSENSSEITNIPADIVNDYNIKVIDYYDWSNNQKTYAEIGGVIQEAGIYTIEISPNPKYGAWENNAPTMTVTVNKATIDLSDSSIFRLGVTSDNGASVLNLRPGKEIANEQQTSLYYYSQTGSWYTSEQTGIGDITRQEDGLWNCFVRAQNTDFKLALITPIVKDAHTGEDIFTCVIPDTTYNKSSEISTTFTVQIVERELNNYQFFSFSDLERKILGFVDTAAGTAIITKMWYIVQLNNWLTALENGYLGAESPSYNMASAWVYGTNPATLFSQPTVALGLDENPEVSFSIFLESENLQYGTTLSITSVPLAQYSRIINQSLPIGSYRLEFSVVFPDGAAYDTFKQSYLFTITEKGFSDVEQSAIDSLKDMTFEYDMTTASLYYSQNGALFDFEGLDADKADILKDLLGFNGGRSTLGVEREGVWLESTYDYLFDSSFAITYNLNRMWNNTYDSMIEVLRQYPMNTPDTYIVYYQMTAKNRKSLINESNDTERRQYAFTVVVYRTLSVPTIRDLVYDGTSLFPTISYPNNELAYEQTYYSVTLPASQDNVNVMNASGQVDVKTAYLTIPASYYDHYRFAGEGDSVSARVFSDVIAINYYILPADNSSTERLYIADWSWNTPVVEEDILWQTRFGNDRDTFVFTLVPQNGEDSHIYTIDEFQSAPAGSYILRAYCPADAEGNWKEFIDEHRITISVAVNTWVKSPSISTWVWNQYENFDFSASGAVSPIEINAIPTYYSLSAQEGTGTGSFTFRIYTISDDDYDLVYFDEANTQDSFQYEKNADGSYKMVDGKFVVPISVAKTLANLPAGQYYLVATVYSHANYTGLNNSLESFLQGAVPFTISIANNLWVDTIATADWVYSEFELGRHIYTATSKYDTTLAYSIFETVGDVKSTTAVTVLGVKLEAITDFTASVMASDGKNYTYAELVNLLNVGAYTITVHGDEAAVNERGGINYGSLDDSRRFNVTKAVNTLTTTFALNSFTIGGSVDLYRYTARFESASVGYRISQGGTYVDGLSDTKISEDPITYTNSLSYDALVTKIAQLTASESGSQYTIWYVTKGGDNYTAYSEGLAFTVYLGQNDWLGAAPTMDDWTYDATAHPFSLSGISLVHEVDDDGINVTYYEATLNEHTGQYVLGSALTACPIDTGIYFVRIAIGSDEYYKGFSIDLFFRVNMADNDFAIMPSIRNGGWEYSQLSIDDITTGVPTYEEDSMYVQYVVTRTITINGISEEERLVAMTWVLGREFNNNLVALEAFYSRLNALEVGEYKLNITLSSSANYNETVLDAITLTVSKARNGWQEGKAPTVTSATSWQWDKYQESTWNDIAAKFGNVTIYVDEEAVSALSVARFLSTLEAGEHTIRFDVAETDNYEGFHETVTFHVLKNSNGWKDGDKDTTAFVNGWVWGTYDNDIAGGNPIWAEPRPNYGTPYAAIYRGKNGVGGTLIRENVALYSLDILMNFLDAGEYYLIWTVAGDSNYESITREYINFKISVNPNGWDANYPATMVDNDKADTTGIAYGWTKGDYGKDSSVDYFTMPVSLYGIVVAKIIACDSTWNETSVVVEGVSNSVSISSTFERLSAGRYKLLWSAIDAEGTGNFQEIQYPNVIEFIVNRGVASWTGDAPFIDSWQWGAFNSSLWKAPGIESANPVATIVRRSSGEHIADYVSTDLLSSVLELLEVGEYRLIWTAEGNDDFEIQGDEPGDLDFTVTQNRNGWVIAPSISATDNSWQWQTFTLGYWQMPTPQYDVNNQLDALIYRIKDGYDFHYDALNHTYSLVASECELISGISLATLDGINSLSVGKYLIVVSVPEDDMGRYMGIETILPFTIVPNANEFTSTSCYINGYSYSDFRGYWRAPSAQFGEILAYVYKVVGTDKTLIDAVDVEDLNDTLRDLHVGNYEVVWTIVEDEAGNYLGGKTTTSVFSVIKADNYWLQRPTITTWAWGSFDVNKVAASAIPLYTQSGVNVYFKLTDADYNDLSDYFTDISKIANILKTLKPDTYHLLAYYPEIEDYNILDVDNDCAFAVALAENKWVMTPDVVDWTYGSPTNLPTGSALYGESVTYTYYKAVLDASGNPVFKDGKYQVVEDSAFGGWTADQIAEAGVYIVQADVEGSEYYAPLSTQFVLRISDSKYNYWKVQPTIQSWILGTQPCLPEGEAQYGEIVWTYYKAEWSETLGKFVPVGEALELLEGNSPEEVGQYVLVASVEAEEGSLIANIHFEIFEEPKAIAGDMSSDILVYIDITLGVVASIFTIVVISAVVRRYRKNDSVNE